MNKLIIVFAAWLALSASVSLAAVTGNAVVEGTIIRFNQKEVVISNRGSVQKIPRALIPDATDLHEGMFITIEVPISPQ